MSTLTLTPNRNPDPYPSAKPNPNPTPTFNPYLTLALNRPGLEPATYLLLPTQIPTPNPNAVGLTSILN